MAAPTNSGESDMATGDFFLNPLSPLPSPRWSPLRLTPSPPRHFLPSSSSMVMQYQGCNQSMDNPPQNQEHDDIVDPPPYYLAGDLALLQQQLRKNNQGFQESNMGFEEESEEEMMNCFYFPPSSPTYFHLCPPMPSVFFVSINNIKDISLALSYQHILEDKSGALHVMNWEEGHDIFDLLVLCEDFGSYLDNKFNDLDQRARAAGVLPKDLESLVGNIEDDVVDGVEVTLRRINWFEQDDEDIVDQPVVYERVSVVQQLIQNRDGELDVILGGGVFTINGLERRDGTQGSPTTPETLLICQANLSFRVWLGHGGQWVAKARYRCSRLNIGSFTTVEDAISTYDMVWRWCGRTDPTGFPRLFENENRSKLPLQLPPPTQELNLEDLDWCAGTGSERTGECVMADETRLNSGYLGKRKTKEKNPGGERRNKKTNKVRIAIPLEDILQTKAMSLKDAANHLEDEDFGNVEAEAVGMGSGGTGQSDMEEGQLRYLGREKRKEMTSGGERRNKKNAISLEDILLCKEMPQKVAAKHFKVSLSTLKRACRGHGIPSWPPCGERNQSRPNKSPAVVDKEPIPQLNSDKLLPSNQVSATIGTKSVTVKARFSTVTMKFQLSWPWRMVELKQQVEKRLGHEAENYYICYKDQDNDDDLLIACDEDLQDHISHSSLPGTNSIEVFLKPK